MKRTLIGAVVAAALTFAAIPDASAAFSLKLGTRWEWARYTASPVRTSGFALAWQNTDLVPYFGVGITDTFSLNLALDFGYSSHRTHLVPVTAPPGDSYNFYMLGAALSFKWYFSAPKKERVHAYLWGEVFGYLAGVRDPVTANDVATAAANNFTAAVERPYGGSIAFGMEYFFSKFFSMGAEIFGVRYTHLVGTDRAYTPGGAQFTRMQWNFISMYTMLTLNFHIFGLLEVRAKVYTDEDDASKKKKKGDDDDDDRGRGDDDDDKGDDDDDDDDDDDYDDYDDDDDDDGYDDYDLAPMFVDPALGF